ncbi:MAG: hypothetical protein D6811_02030 [Alphaproteobacteria bacterium]|nr:MAG: hypothetical protein D6811_02030 [Alphaproteobacteria bacterium]
MRRALAGLALALAALAPAEAREITAEELASLPPADVVIVGEVHDNPVHHVNQAKVIAAVRPRALVFEMLTDAQARRLRPELVDNPELLDAVLGWSAAGWPDIRIYLPVFRAARGLPAFGGAVPREAARRAVREGAAAVLGDSAALFGLDEPLPPEEQSLREAEQAEAHCNALPEDLLPGMVAAQRLRDAALARAVIAAMAETGGPVVVITGNGHTRRDRGVPLMLARAAPELRVLSIGQLEAQPEEGETPPFDLWLVTPPHPRPDPCEELRRRQ